MLDVSIKASWLFGDGDYEAGGCKGNVPPCVARNPPTGAWHSPRWPKTYATLAQQGNFIASTPHAPSDVNFQPCPCKNAAANRWLKFNFMTFFLGRPQRIFRSRIENSPHLIGYCGALMRVGMQLWVDKA